MNLRRYLNISAQVQDAPRRGKFAVALDSATLVSSAPYPQNAVLAAAVQNAVLEAGAVPAVTAITDGVMRVGLKDSEMDALCKKELPIATRQTLPYILATGQTAATSVGGAMLMAVLAGIHVQASGGICGVNGESLSVADADLQELRQSSVAVFSCGLSQKYNAEATLAYLATYGVPVIGVGTSTLPRVYENSEIILQQTVKDAREAAQLSALKWNMGLRGGVLALTAAGNSNTQNALDALTASMRICARTAAEAAAYMGV